MRRHVEIAGAGLSGLSAAVAFARRGWSVRVHERTAALRPEGYDLALYRNGLQVLHALGVLAPLLAAAVPITSLKHRDRNDALAAEKTLPQNSVFRISRQRLTEELAAAAEHAGAEFRLQSAAVAADAGALVTDDGARWPADLVIAADGVNSVVRERLGLTRVNRLLPDGTFRFLLPAVDHPSIAADRSSLTEWWSGTRRFLHIPSQAGFDFFALSCHAGDSAGRAVPLDVPSWSASFPTMAGIFEQLRRDVDWNATRWTQFRVVRLRRWSCGNVALTGDAAHAMAPNIGQGGGTALMDGLSLAVAANDATDIPAALAQWERAERPLVEGTQCWAGVYSALTYWPQPLRTPILGMCSSVKLLRDSMSRAANCTPTGAIGLPPALVTS